MPYIPILMIFGTLGLRNKRKIIVAVPGVAISLQEHTPLICLMKHSQVIVNMLEVVLEI